MDNVERNSLLNAKSLHAFCLIFIAVGVITTLPQGRPSAVFSAYFLLLFTHMGFSLYRGVAERKRKISWAVLCLSLLALNSSLFVGYLFPMGQIQLWFATHAPFLAGNTLIGQSLLTTIGLLISLAILLFDICTSFTDKSQTMLPKLLIVFAIALGLVVTFALINFQQPTPPLKYSPSDPLLTPTHIVPEWYVLPYYAVLRAIPSKLGGVILMFIAIAAPLSAIFISKTREKTRRWLINMLLLLCFFGFIGLSYYGALPAEQEVILRTRLLAMCFLGYFLLGPIVAPKRNIDHV